MTVCEAHVELGRRVLVLVRQIPLGIDDVRRELDAERGGHDRLAEREHDRFAWVREHTVFVAGDADAWRWIERLAAEQERCPEEGRESSAAVLDHWLRPARRK